MSASSFGASPESITTDADYGLEFTPRAFTMTYSPAAAWHKPQLVPIDQLARHPSAVAGHHDGQVAIEGLKAFRRIDGTIAAFRPWDHARRFRTCARRSAMPALPDDLFVSAVEELVEADAGWLDEAPGSSLYLRSRIFTADTSPGLGSPQHYGFALTAQRGSRPTEAGSTDRDQAQGADLFVVRATRPRAEVALLEPQIAAPPGIVAESVLTLASRLGYIARQQRSTLDEWRKYSSQDPTETFTCSIRNGIAAFGDGEPGPVTEAIREALLDIQSGREPGPRGWMYQIPSADAS